MYTYDTYEKLRGTFDWQPYVVVWKSVEVLEDTPIDYTVRNDEGQFFRA